MNAAVCAAPVGVSVFECADKLGIPIATSCRKQGKCRECVIEVAGGADLLSAPADPERHLHGSFRLACCARITAQSGTIRINTLRRGAMRIERKAFHLPSQGGRPSLDPAVMRRGESVLLDGKEIDRRRGPVHGLAIDIGTTTVVLRLFNLETGEAVADSAFENPQRFGGSDVMARIRFDDEDGTRSLQRTLAAHLGHAIEQLPVDPHSIYEVVVAGNSTMRDLFFRLPVHSIGQSPYHSITETERAQGLRQTTSLSEAPRKLGLPTNPAGRVYGMPIISGHVGADAAACMLAIDLEHEDRLVAVMDIGTNTELILGNRHRVIAASCPAGPAFEGGQLSCGMPGLPGAIEKVSIAGDGSVSCSVIDGLPPEGICGSGLVELLGELLRTGRMNEFGRLEDGSSEFPVASAPDGRNIALSEADISLLAQAKGANVAGLRVAAAEYGVPLEAIDVFYLAGGFGRHLNLEAARRIGLVPDLPLERMRQIGNASLEGACQVLLSLVRRRGLEALVDRVAHCRLETHASFFDFFVEGCLFRAVGSRG